MQPTTRAVTLNYTYRDIELEENMLFAHRDRGKRALVELEAVARAPALFKPEFTERASRDFDAARAGADLWSA